MKKHKKVVIKVGTKVITAKDRTIDRDTVRAIANEISDIRDKGVSVILVTSGAIGAGMTLLNLKKRPSRLSELQATAAIGQSHLMHLYSEYFRARGYMAGQILLTQEDFNDRARYLNIKNTIQTLLRYGAIPIINENDTVATDEIRCGDNDRLSSLVADLCGVDKLVILTEVDGLLDENGKTIKFVETITPKILKLGGKSHCDLGTGGMATKIEAAGIAAKAGIDCVIVNGKEKGVLTRLLIQDEDIGTSFASAKTRFIAKKRWIAYSSRTKGAIRVDDGAKDALLKKDKSLLASGIVAVEGDFSSGDAVSITDRNNEELARGIANYSSGEVTKIKGLKTSSFKSVLGYKGRDEVIHKDNLVIL